MSEPTTSMDIAATLIRRGSHAAYLLALGHASGPHAYQCFKDPKPGDHVWESSTAYMPSRDWHAVGKLLRIVQEPVAMEWNEQEDGPHPQERVWYIELLDGRESRWTNCEFLKVPMDPRALFPR
jgi:hypothetical protein